MGEAEPDATAEDQGENKWWANLIAWLVIIGTVAGIVLLVTGLHPDELEVSENPSFIDNIFNSKIVVLFARLLLVSAALVLAFGGVFIIVSTIVRMQKGEWLRRAGPFEVSETALNEIEDQIQFWRTAALEGQEEVEELRQRLEESDELIEQLHLEMDDG